MSTEVRVPTTGNAGEDVVIAQWAVAVGDTVAEGDVLVVLETAKSTVDIEAPASGTILQISAEEGAEVAEFAVIAVIGQAGEAVVGRPPSDGDETPQPPTPEGEEPVLTPVAPGPLEAAPRTSDDDRGRSGGRVKVSPRAAIMAERNDVSLEGISGSGPGGRIIVADVIAAKAAPVSPARPSQRAVLEPAFTSEYELVPVRGARKVTATRMLESLQNSAQVTLTRYADATRLFEYASRLKDVTEAAELPRITINDLLLFAVARAVAKHPAANAAFDWDGIRRYRHVNLGFAVDTGEALLVPVIERADSISLQQLAESAHTAIDRAKAGTLTAEEMSRGTFTVSNLGGLGVHWFTPVLNPPQAGILGIGAAHQAYPDAPRQLPLSLTFDHRALDGAAAATLLAEIAQTIETADVLSAFTA